MTKSESEQRHIFYKRIQYLFEDHVRTPTSVETLRRRLRDAVADLTLDADDIKTICTAVMHTYKGY